MSKLRMGADINGVAKMRIVVGLFSVLLIAVAPIESAAKNFRTKQPSDEEKKTQEEQRLRDTPLKLDNNCEPSMMTKLWLKTLNEQQVKYFWIGQKYAVERAYKTRMQMLQASRIDREADRRIAEINAQRDAAQLAASGVRQRSSPEFDRAIADSDRIIRQAEADMARSSQQWAQRCYRIADEKSR